MITTLLATASAAATTTSTAADKIAIPSIRYLAILPPIIMIGGAVVLLAAASLVKAPLRVRVGTIGSARAPLLTSSSPVSRSSVAR